MQSYGYLQKQLAGLTSDSISAELARRHFSDFVQHTKKDYVFNWHHLALCEKLEAFAKGQIKKLAIFMPPQHGKSELSTRRLPAYILGLRPSAKIAICSYADTLAQSFNRDIQRIIDDTAYHQVFPETYLNASNVSNDAHAAYLRNASIFETVGHRGFVKTVGVGGSLTGTPVDIGMIDDPFKDREEAMSIRIRNKVASWHADVFRTRMHNDSQELLIMTRWDEDDLAGRLLAIENDWTVVMFQGIKDRNIPGDPRRIGQALWPEKHSLERLLKVKRDSPITFNSLYQQEPKADENTLVYPKWDEVATMPGVYPVVYGLDFGFTNDPTVIVAIEVHKNDIWIDELVYKPGMLNNDIKKAAVAHGIGFRRIIADHDEKDITELQKITVDADTMEKLPKLNITAAEKGPGSVVRQVGMCRKLRIHVTTRSHNLKRELKSYVFVTHGTKVSNEPVDANNHACDAWRYAYIMYNKTSKIRV